MGTQAQCKITTNALIFQCMVALIRHNKYMYTSMAVFSWQYQTWWLVWACFWTPSFHRFVDCWFGVSPRASPTSPWYRTKL